MPHAPRRVALLAALLLAAPADASDDRFLAGYAAAVVEREFGLEARLRVERGVVRIAAPEAAAPDRERLGRALQQIEGVREVVFVEEAALAAPAAAVAPAGFELLPERELFDPLLADPRWPHFSASAQRYLGDDELRSIAATSFGETIPLAAADGPFGGRVELGLHAGVFSIFDLDSSSFDLVNSDFLVGLAGVWRRGNVAALLRIHHQSSHLGDEFLLRNRVERINLSYEEVDAIVSWNATETLRLYGGGGWLVRTDPSDLERGLLQLGGEWIGRDAWLAGSLRPLAALDLQSRQESDWDVDLSLRAGFQLEGRRVLGSRVQLLVEFYDGRSPNGQFFERDVTYVGTGVHLQY